MTQAGTSGNPQNTQAIQGSYTESPYRDQVWESVGERQECDEFLPMEVASLSGGKMVIDPMFPDYGGRYGKSQSARPYLAPGELAQKRKMAEEEAKPKGLVIPEEELERMLKETAAKASEEAFRRGQQEGDAKLRVMNEALTEVLRDYNQQNVERATQLERQAVELVLAIAEKIIGYAVEINPEYIVHVVKEAIGHVGSAHIGKVRVSLQDMEFIEVLGIQKSITEFEDLQFVADETIRAGCVVETSAGEIDFQIDKAWDKVKENVVKVLV